MYRTPGHAFAAHDRVLDRRATGPLWLKDPPIADLVSHTILIGDCGRQFYRLCAWVVMPNHVHLPILPLVPIPILSRTGQPFWQDESTIRYLRSSSQIGRTSAYIEENPVSAGLVCSAELWPWSSAGWQAKPPAYQIYLFTKPKRGNCRRQSSRKRHLKRSRGDGQVCGIGVARYRYCAPHRAQDSSLFRSRRRRNRSRTGAAIRRD